MKHMIKNIKYQFYCVLFLLFIPMLKGNALEFNQVYSEELSFNENKALIYQELKSNINTPYDTIRKYIDKLPTESKAHYYLQLGKINYTNLKNDSIAKATILLSLDEFEKLKQLHGIADCYFYLGKIEGKNNNSQTFIKNIKKAIDCYAKIENFNAYCISNMTIANYLSKLNNSALANTYYQNAIDNIDKMSNTQFKQAVLLNTANHQYKYKNYDTALQLYQQLLNESTGNNLKRLSIVYNNIGGIYITQREWHKARIYLSKALKFKEEIEDTETIPNTIQNLFITSLSLNNLVDAKYYFNRFNDLNNKQRLPTSLILDFNYNAIKYYALCNNPKELHIHLKHHTDLKDSLSNAAFSDKLIEMQKSFELKEKDREIALLEKEDALKQARIKSKNIIIIAVSIIATLLLVLGYVLLRQRRELIQSKKRLIRQKDDITGMNEQLRVSNLAKDRILAVIGHDLRGPVGGLKELIELYMDLPEFEEDDIDNLLVAARESSTSTYHLLENLLSWANSQRGDIEFKPQAAPLAPLIIHSVQLLDKSINTRGVKFSYDIPESLVVQVDINMLRTIIRNLVSNAIKYSKEGSEVKIMAYAKANIAHLCICDNGSGMTGEETQSVFTKKETYFIGSEYSAKGTGLGLILCQEFVERHGGRIWIESEQGMGTKVCFTLPNSTQLVEELTLEEAYR